MRERLPSCHVAVRVTAVVCPHMTQLREVAIVGAGLLGLAAGRALAARGRDVVILEQADVGNAGGGSKGSCRIFRLGYAEPEYVRAARRARELWRELEQQTGRTILYPVPHLTFGTGLRAVHDAMRDAGAPCELLPAAEVEQRFPALRVGGPALLEPESCVTAADEALAALLDPAGHGGPAGPAGPELRTGVRVTSLSDDGRQVLLRTSKGPVTARLAIVTAGPWSSGLLATAGISVPSRPTLEQVAYLKPADSADSGDAVDTMPIFINHADRSPYGLPVPGSSLYKIGIHQSGPVTDPDAQDQSASPALVDHLSEVARRYLPEHDPQPSATERCVYDNSPDEDFVVDRVGNIVVGCGTSGHGFKFGPLFGEWLAELATGPASSPAGSPARPSARFAIGRFRPPA
jgi:sarcosine oxidase